VDNSNRIVLSAIAVLALVLGLGFGALALVASLGVWLGLWQFGTGFAILTIAHDWGWIIAIMCVLDAIAIFVLARALGMSNGPRLAGFALVGAIAAALAYFIPETYRPPEGTPPIHDISTDTNDPPQFVDALPLRANAANSAVYGDSPGLTAESLAEMQKTAYPEIVSQYFDEPPAAVYSRAIAAVRSLGWDVVAEVPAEGRIEATDTTFWFRFKDDIVIRIRPTPTGSVLDARSVSRVGRSDVGKNAARLREFIAAL